jgi:hypothetical protein
VARDLPLRVTSRGAKLRQDGGVERTTLAARYKLPGVAGPNDLLRREWGRCERPRIHGATIERSTVEAR